MEDKSKVIKSLIALAIVLVVLVGISFAYFSSLQNFNAGEVSGGVTTTFDISLNTPNEGYINATDLLPILSTEVSQFAELATFSVVSGNNANIVNYSISLIDLNISNNLRNSAFRWQLISLNDPLQNRSGTFENIPGTRMSVIENILIPANTTHNFEFRIWIETDGVTPQNSMLNGSFSGRFSMVSNMVYGSS